MKVRNILIALGVLAVLVIAGLALFRDPAPTDRGKSFPDVKKDSITRIWMNTPESLKPDDRKAGKKPAFEEIEIVREGAGEGATWKLTKPVAYPAYGSYVDTLLTRMEEIELLDVAVEDRANWEALEIDDAQAVHVKAWAGEALLVEFFIGAYKSGNTLVRLPGDDRVYKVQGSIRYVFGKASRDWRDKSMIEVDSKTVTRATFKTANGTFDFQKDGEEWQILAGEGLAAVEGFDPKKVPTFVGSASALRAADFADGADPATVGLNPPKGEVTITATIPAPAEAKDADEVKAEQDAGTSPMATAAPSVVVHRILVGDAKDDKYVYVMVDDGPQVFLVTKYTAERLSPTADKFAASPKTAPAGGIEALPPPPPGAAGTTGDGGSLPPDVMKAVQAEIKKQQLLKKLSGQPAQP